MEKIPHAQLVPRSRMALRPTRSGLKIATDIAGMLGSSEKPLQDRAVRSHWRQWRLTTVRRARWSQWRKYLTVVMFRSSLVPRSDFTICLFAFRLHTIKLSIGRQRNVKLRYRVVIKVFKAADGSSALLYPEEGVDSCSQIPKVCQVWAAAVGQLLFTLYVYVYCFSL
jgi:hypothetical protein